MKLLKEMEALQYREKIKITNLTFHQIEDVCASMTTMRISAEAFMDFQEAFAADIKEEICERIPEHFFRSDVSRQTINAVQFGMYEERIKEIQKWRPSYA